jgi:hypothetical protein
VGDRVERLVVRRIGGSEGGKKERFFYYYFYAYLRIMLVVSTSNEREKFWYKLGTTVELGWQYCTHPTLYVARVLILSNKTQTYSLLARR